MSDFANNFITRLYGKLPDEELEIVQKELTMYCADFKIERMTKELSVEVKWVPSCLENYFVDRIVAGYSKNTIYMNKLYLEDFFNQVQKPIELIQKTDIQLYLFRLQQERGISNRTLDSRRAMITCFFKWAAAEEYISKDPSATIKRIKFKVEPRKPLTPMEREKVRVACKTLYENTLFEVFYSTGARVGEICNLKWENVNLHTQEVRLFGKGNKWRTAFLTEKAANLLALYFEASKCSEYVFNSPNARNTKPCARTIQRLIAEIGERSGIGRRLFPHLIRHTTATDLVSHGMAIQEVQKCMGHERIETTMVYAHINNEQTKVDHGKFIA